RSLPMRANRLRLTMEVVFQLRSAGRSSNSRTCWEAAADLVGNLRKYRIDVKVPTVCQEHKSKERPRHNTPVGHDLLMAPEPVYEPPSTRNADGAAQHNFGQGVRMEHDATGCDGKHDH